MPLHIVRDDIANMRTDAVVVPANASLVIDGGAGASVARIAGMESMQAACDAAGGCPVGSAVVTPAFDFPADIVVHAVGPVWSGGQSGEAEALRSCVAVALERARAAGAKSVAMPLLATGAFGFPVGEALTIEVRAIRAFLEEHESDIWLVLYNRESMREGRAFFDEIDEYIDDVYVDERQGEDSVRYRDAGGTAGSRGERPVAVQRSDSDGRRLEEERSFGDASAISPAGAPAPMAASMAPAASAPEVSLKKKGLLKRLSERRGGRGESSGEIAGEIEKFERKGASGSGVDGGFLGEPDVLEGLFPQIPSAAPGPAQHAAQFPPAAESAQHAARFPSAAAEPAQHTAPEPALHAAQYPQEAMPESVAFAAPRSLEERLGQLDESFAQTVLRLIDERGMDDVQVYKRANMSRQLFAKIRKDDGYRPAKKTACALAIALGLNREDALVLLSRAGFTLSHSSKFDVIVEYYLVSGIYDIYQVNEALFAYDQPLLG